MHESTSLSEISGAEELVPIAFDHLLHDAQQCAGSANEIYILPDGYYSSEPRGVSDWVSPDPSPDSKPGKEEPSICGKPKCAQSGCYTSAGKLPSFFLF